LFFANCGHLQALKVRDLKLLCPNQLHGLKDGKSKSEFKLKKNIGEGMKMFGKYQFAIWLLIRNFYSHFEKVTHKCECFGRIVEHCHKHLCG
jgi:hypothetical protein